MSSSPDQALSKVPAVTLGFWIIKILATTLGETGGDAVSMSMNLGYLVGTGIFLVIFIAAVYAQMAARKFHPFMYWATIIASTTVGTTLADFADRTLGIGYLGGSTLLLCLLLSSLFVWYRSLGSIDVSSVSSPSSEFYYWLTIMFSQTLGTALFWTAFILTRPLGAVVGDFIDKPANQGGLELSRYSATAVLLTLIVVFILVFPQRAASKER